ncbi:uncharacterized protein [Chiloscyllium punctatum]|uniref:uncharacterized protein n=1 Tax=Chiloscyllium punctatum TaxID=137246 RepID=UPI003B63CFB7
MTIADILKQLKAFFLNSNTKSYSIIGTVMLLLLYGLEELIEKEIPCPCTSTEANLNYTGLLFGLPAVILFLISLLLHVETNQFGSIWKFCKRCSCVIRSSSANTQQTSQNSGQSSNNTTEGDECKDDCCRICFCVFKPLFLFIKLLIAPIIWLSILFLDGDYYACSVIMWSGKVDNIACAEFNCERDSNSFLIGQQHHCDDSRLIGGLLLCTSLICLLLFYFICYCFGGGENKYHYEYEYECVYKNNEKAIIMEKITERAKKQVNEKIGKDISDKYQCIPKLARSNESGAAESDQRQNSPSTPHSRERHSSDGPTGYVLSECIQLQTAGS